MKLSMKEFYIVCFFISVIAGIPLLSFPGKSYAICQHLSKHPDSWSITFTDAQTADYKIIPETAKRSVLYALGVYFDSVRLEKFFYGTLLFSLIGFVREFVIERREKKRTEQGDGPQLP